MQSVTQIKPTFKYSIAAADTQINSTYLKGLSSALVRFNVDGVVLSTIQIKDGEDTYLILADLEAQHEVGGIRLEIKTPNNKLPIENCRTPNQSKIQNKINALIKENKVVAEVSGLWVNPVYKGLGLAPSLALEATELGLGLGVDALITMLPLHTLGHFTKLGYTADPDIPQMAYPDDRYISTIVWFFSAKPTKIKLVQNQFDLNHESMSL